MCDGFAETVVFASALRRELVIRPDDVWLALMAQFSRYLRGRPDAVADYFVDSRLAQTAMFRGDPVNSKSWHVEACLRDSSIREWILPEFVTTTELDRLAAAACLFPGELCLGENEPPNEVRSTPNMRLFGRQTAPTPESLGNAPTTGIEKVDLRGTLTDWEDVERRARRFRDFEIPGGRVMGEWASRLKPVLEKFVRDKRLGKTDLCWYNAACHLRRDFEENFFFQGWLANFCAFSDAGKWQLRDDQIIRANNIPGGLTSLRVTHFDVGVPPRNKELRVGLLGQSDFFTSETSFRVRCLLRDDP